MMVTDLECEQFMCLVGREEIPINRKAKKKTMIETITAILTVMANDGGGGGSRM